MDGRGSRSAYRIKPIEAPVNSPSESDLSRHRSEFDGFYARNGGAELTFSQRARDLMRTAHWNSKTFSDKTLLNDNIYSQLKNKDDYVPKKATVMAICVGLDLNILDTEDLLRRAGHALSNTRTDRAYYYIIDRCYGKTIVERNLILEALGVPPLEN